MACEVLGLGGVMIDNVLMVSHEFLSTIPGEKGGMERIDYPTLKEILARSGVAPAVVPGGCSANIMKGLACFGRKAGMLGKIGKDPMGKFYINAMNERDVSLVMIESETPTAQLLALVTPDGERTFRTFQGASVEMGKSDLKKEFFAGVRLLHVEGYSLFNGDLAESAMKMAKEMGCKISFDLASFEIVRAFKPTIMHLLQNYIDIIFCNEFEARELTGLSEEKTSDFLAKLCEVSVVCMGKRGCFVHSGEEHFHFPAFVVDKPLDTTGAGDLFASGFLAGYLGNRPLQECALYGSLAGAAVIQVPGAEIPHEGWEQILGTIAAVAVG